MKLEINLVAFIFWPLVIYLAATGTIPWWFVGLMALHEVELKVRFR